MSRTRKKAAPAGWDSTLAEAARIVD
jgi:hypothetical protein